MKKYIDKFKSLEKGQKIKVVAVTALLLIVLYMILGMFSSSDSSDTSVANSTPAKEKVVTKRLIAQVAVQQKVTKPAVVTSTLSKKQKKYLQSVNELQMLQLQQQIVQTKQQIAAAELKAAQSDIKRKEVTAPPPPPPTFNSFTTNNKAAPVVVTPTISNNYKLQYIANEGGKWQVIISLNGRLINGTIGTELPDGSKISKIDGNSVTLNLKGETETLTIASTM